MAESRNIPVSRKLLIPKPEEIEGAKQILKSVSGTRVTELTLIVKNDAGSSKSLVLPAQVARFFLEALSEIADGNALRLIEIRRELTTHEAADFLNVSRTHLIGLLGKGVIPHRLVGSHRRIALTDLLVYKQNTDVRRKEALDAMAAEAQVLKLYD